MLLVDLDRLLRPRPCVTERLHLRAQRIQTNARSDRGHVDRVVRDRQSIARHVAGDPARSEQHGRGQEEHASPSPHPLDIFEQTRALAAGLRRLPFEKLHRLS